MTSNERVHPDKNGASNPGFGHTCRVEWILQGKNIKGLFSRRREDSSVLMLEQRVAQQDGLVCTSICTSPKAGRDTVDAQTGVNFIDDYLTAL